MAPKFRVNQGRGMISRALVFCACLFLVGCAGAKPSGETVLRPNPYQAPTYQVVGDAIVASLGGVSVTLGWLNESGVERFYASREGLVVPWPKELWKESPPIVFLLRISNQTREEVQFDPAMVALVAQVGERQRPIPYEEMYMRLQETEGAQPRLQSLQATLFSRFVVIPPSGRREGLLLFSAIDPEAKLLMLDLGSFFVGGRVTPGRFEFQVVR
jgi:hypothetical protein